MNGLARFVRTACRCFPAVRCFLAACERLGAITLTRIFRAGLARCRSSPGRAYGMLSMTAASSSTDTRALRATRLCWPGADRCGARLRDGRLRSADPRLHAAGDRRGPASVSSAQAGSLVTWTLIGAVAGGMIFGVLSDYFGRVRMLTWTILIFAVFTGLCALAQGYADLLAYRTIAGLGLGGEFGIGMTLVAEAWPASQRARVSSYVGLGWQLGRAGGRAADAAAVAGDRLARHVRAGTGAGRGVVHRATARRGAGAVRRTRRTR